MYMVIAMEICEPGKIVYLGDNLREAELVKKTYSGETHYDNVQILVVGIIK